MPTNLPVAAHFIHKGAELLSAHAIPAGVNIPCDQVAFPMVGRFLVGGLRGVAGGVEPASQVRAARL